MAGLCSPAVSFYVKASYKMRIPDSPPKIEPLPDGTHRPLWSVMIPVYNCAPYLPILLESVLSQALSEDEMQIEVIDDCSTDADIGKIVNDIGKGRVGYYRQPRNVGSLRNFETCLNRSRGQLIHLLHGDDRLLPGFYKEMTATFKEFPEVGSAFCAHHHIDAKGNVRYNVNVDGSGPFILSNWLEILAERQRPQYAAMVVKRSVYEHLGSFYGVVYG
jgi:glycosyltransferase involved in cell wall biosynthesis